MGENEKAGLAYVALSRTTKFKNLIVKDIDEYKFKSYITSGKAIKTQLNKVRYKEREFLKKLNKNKMNDL